jgi:glycine hydroxymethyltransferase
MNTAPAELLRPLAAERLQRDDPVLGELLRRERHRQATTLSMIAASSVADPSVLACEGSVLMHTTTEGYPGARFHAGCEVADEVERLAIERACAVFGARYANVQPHSGTSANQIVLFALLDAHDTILGMELGAGGHLSHGSRASVTGKYFNSVSYGLDAHARIDYEGARRLALEHRPRVMVCGASAYPRAIDFARFRAIADEAGALLLADISHISGLVAAGEHPSPIDHAHITTTSTYKQLFGPRGGLILMGRDHDAPAPNGQGTLAEALQRAVFPFFQGTPHLNAIAAKARALGWVATPEFRELARRITAGARSLASELGARGYRLVSGGSDNHIVMVELAGVSGLVAEGALESCGIIVNKNLVPGDRRGSRVTSGLRFGTNTLALRGMGGAEMERCAELVDRCLRAVHPLGDRAFTLDDDVRDSIREEVAQLCREFPLPGYEADD